jgi:hypothetical protein
MALVATSSSPAFAREAAGSPHAGALTTRFLDFWLLVVRVSWYGSS